MGIWKLIGVLKHDELLDPCMMKGGGGSSDEMNTCWPKKRGLWLRYDLIQVSNLIRVV